MTDPTTGAVEAADQEPQAASAPEPPTLVQRLLAELLGTFVLVLVGCGAVAMLLLGRHDALVLSTGLAFGLTLAVLTYALGRVSGGHFNPAVSLAAAAAGRLAWLEALAYMGAQLVGAIVAGGGVWVLVHGFDLDALGAGSYYLGANSFGDEGSGYAWWAAFLLEAVLTMVLVLVVLGVTDIRNEHPALAPLAIGLVFAAVYVVAFPATRASVNPARSIGPALFTSTDAVLQLWLFILAPLLGGLVAAVLYPLTFGRVGDPVPGSGLVVKRAPRAAAVPGYGAPDQYQQQWNQQAWGAQGEAAGWGAQPQAAQPIIQDGWLWDVQRQQWVPAPPELLQRHTPAPGQQTGQPYAGSQGGAHAQPQAGEDQLRPGPGDTAGGATQVRPPEGQ